MTEVFSYLQSIIILYSTQHTYTQHSVCMLYQGSLTFLIDAVLSLFRDCFDGEAQWFLPSTLIHVEPECAQLLRPTSNKG